MSDRAVTLLALVAGLILLAMPAPADAQDFTRASIEVDGRTRTFLIHVPTSWQAGDAPMPVIMGFHGKGGSGNSMKARFRNWSSQGYVLVFPDALRDPTTGTIHWNTRSADGTEPNWLDVDFVEALVHQMRQLPFADGTAIYATGFSSGGAMTWQLATDARSAGWFRGYAPVSNALTLSKVAHAAPARSLPLIYIHGTADDNWVRSGSLDPNGSVRWLVANNRCDTAQVVERLYPDQGDQYPWYDNGQWQREQTMVTAQYYPSNPGAPDGGAAVAFLTIVDGGHSWPKTFNAPDSPTHCRDIDAADEIIRFWRREAGLR